MARYKAYGKILKATLGAELFAPKALAQHLLLYLFVITLFHTLFLSAETSFDQTWYIIITFCLLFSAPSLPTSVEEDIRNGRMLYFFMQPRSYLHMKLFEGFGASFLRLMLLAIAGLGIGLLLTQHLPTFYEQWPYLLLCSLQGLLLYHLLLLCIGLTAFWFQPLLPVFYLNMTAMFCFGGLLLPLGAYPEQWSSLCFWTPYPWILWWPAQWVTDPNHYSLVYAFTPWLLWVLFLYCTAIVLYRQHMKSLRLHGALKGTL